jgi:DNA-binding transcriptional LysR family regulator
VLPAKHKLAKRKKIPPQSLSGLKFIGVSRDCAPAFDGLTTSILRKVKVESVITSECVLSSLSFVESGIGFALLPDFVEHMLAPSIVAKPLDLPNQPTINLLVAYRKDDQLPALHFLVNFLQQCFLKSAPKDGH